MISNKAPAHFYTSVTIFAQEKSPQQIYRFIVNSRNIRKRGEICPELRIKTPERRSIVFIVNFEHIFPSVCIDFKQVKCLLGSTLSI